MSAIAWWLGFGLVVRPDRELSELLDSSPACGVASGLGVFGADRLECGWIMAELYPAQYVVKPLAWILPPLLALAGWWIFRWIAAGFHHQSR